MVTTVVMHKVERHGSLVLLIPLWLAGVASGLVGVSDVDLQELTANWRAHTAREFLVSNNNNTILN